MNELVKRALLDVLRVQREGGPSPADLENAPILSDWCRVGPALAGIVTGHPQIEDDHYCITSAVLMIDPEKAWARTVSRFYILRDPKPGFLD